MSERTSPRARSPSRRFLCAWGLGLLLACAGNAFHPTSGFADNQPGKALNQVFKGQVSLGKKGVVTIRYDFASKEQLKDWEDGAPLRIMGEIEDQTFDWFDGRMQIPGTRSVHHIATWTGDVSITATVRPDAERDVGCWIGPSDDENDYCTFTLTEHYFHKWNGKAGGLHSIIQFGDQWREGDSGSDFVGFRYVDRRPPPDPLVPGRAVTFTASWAKGKFRFQLGSKFELKGKPKGRKLKDVKLGFYTVVKRALIDDVTITGKLARDWLKREGVRLAIAADDGPGALDGLPGDVQMLVNGHRGGKLTATAKIVARLGAGRDSPHVRKTLIQELSTGPKKAARPVTELLYHADPSVRTEGIGIVKALLGTTYGYKPKAKEEKRSAAVKKMLAAWDKKPALLGE